MELGDLILLPRPRQLRADRGSCPNRDPQVTVDPHAPPSAQGYRLRLTPSGPEILARDDAGAFYGRATLAQVARQCKNRLPCGEITDDPDFPVRGVMLDVSRDKVPKMETLLALVDDLAAWKINHLELYTEHTFAYRNHPAVWNNASPMTHDEFRQLDVYCKQRFVELVPNQNSFGHFERWLKHPAYRHLAECPDGFESPEGGRSACGSTLCPVEPGSIKLLEQLYGEFLPLFTSRKFNVGCDETWELGQGRSKPDCERLGKGRVYLEFLLKINQLVQRHGCRMHFWGDILLSNPDLISELPADMVLLDWGYEADSPFDQHGALLAALHRQYYVCPGTSSWNSIAGRTGNCLGNLRNAAANGLGHGAIGFLNTDWGDYGHWQYLPISYLGFAAGAALSWCYEANKTEDFIAALDTHVFRDDAGVMGKLACDTGNTYLKPGLLKPNSSALFRLLQSGRIEMPMQLTQTREYIGAVLSPLARARMRRPDANLVRDEFANAGRLLLHACDRGLNTPLSQLESQWRGIVKEHRRLWLARNRLGGLDDSMKRLAPPASPPAVSP
jgi:hypothetical protein